MFSRSLLFAGTLLAATGALAAPVTYTYTADNAAGTLVGAPFGPGATVVIKVNADTTGVAVATVSGSAGKCVQGASGTVSVDGGTSTTAITGPVYVCARDDSSFVGIYSDTGTTFISMSASPLAGFGGLSTTAGPLAFSVNSIHSHNSPLNVTGGTFSMNQPETTNTVASTFEVAAGAATPASIPTLSEWGMIILASLITLGTAFTLRRQRG